MKMDSLVVDDLSEFVKQAEQNTDILGSYMGVRSWLLIAAGVLTGVLILAVIFLFYIYRKQKKRKEEQIMSASLASIEVPVETVQIGKLHEQGERSGQQDCFGVSDESLLKTHGLLAVVADGMGGLSDGDKISTAAVESVLDNFLLYQGKCTIEQQLLMLAQNAVESVNGLLGQNSFGKSGSTLVMGILRDSVFSFLSIGDSRIYLYRHGILMQLNREHVYRNKLALDAVNKEIALSDVYSDSRGSGLTSFLGMGTLQLIDFPAEPIRLISGDVLLLMSDGVYNALDKEELAACLKGEPEDAAEQLRNAIQEKGYVNQDNYTAVIIACK